MKKGLVLLSLIAMFVACGKKEKSSKVEVEVPTVVTQSIEEKKVEEVINPVVIEEISTKEVITTENKTSEAIEKMEESVIADIVETTNGEVVIKELPEEEISIVTTEEKTVQ